MSYTAMRYKGTPFWIGALIVLALLGRCAMMAGDGSTARMDTPEGAERALLADAMGAKVFQTMKRTHPEEFKALTEEVASRTKRGQAEAQIAAVITNFVFEAEQRHRGALEQAGPEALARYRAAEMRVMEALKQADPRYCAAYVVNGQFELPAGATGPAQAVADFHAATWEALADGRDHPAGRKLTQPSQADWTSIEKAMVAGGTARHTMTSFFDPAKSAALDPVSQCDTGLSFRRAIYMLPSDRIDNFYLGLLNAAPS